MYHEAVPGHHFQLTRSLELTDLPMLRRLADFNAYYDPTWGRVKAKTYPTPGNHEYQTSGAAGYFSYFGDRAGPTGRGYYSFNVGSWHLISLNSEISTAAGSARSVRVEVWKTRVSSCSGSGIAAVPSAYESATSRKSGS